MAREFVAPLALTVSTTTAEALTHAQIDSFSVRFRPPGALLPKGEAQWPIMQVKILYGKLNEKRFIARAEEEVEIVGDEVYALLDVASQPDSTLLAYLEKIVLSRRQEVKPQATARDAAVEAVPG